MAPEEWDPDSFLALMHGEVVGYEDLQAALVEATRGLAAPIRTILDLGTGTGETARRVLDAHPEARLIGIDSSEPMLATARAELADRSVELTSARLEDPLPAGPFDLVVSALAVHHLEGAGKADLFARIFAALAPGGRVVIADVILPDDPSAITVPLTDGYDHPSPVAQQLAWLSAAGFTDARTTWSERDLAVLVGERAA